MTIGPRLRIDEAEQKVCDIASRQLGIPRHKVSPGVRIVEDLRCDSLDLVELLTTVEEEFEVTLPDDSPDPIFKAVFTRRGFRLADLAELVYLAQGTGRPERPGWRTARITPSATPTIAFSQLDGRWRPSTADRTALLEPLNAPGPILRYRRGSDGMRCLRIPSAAVELGSDSPESLADERPRRVAEIDAFLIDAETVSTTAYCRFLNSVGEDDPAVLNDWFVLDPEDDRDEHMLIGKIGQDWRPRPGTERWPMILVSWYGANSYSLWANGRDWRCYRGEGETGDVPESFLPSEAQWEYAARGPRSRSYPWGDEAPTPGRMQFGQHRRGATYRAETLPIADVNAELGMSPFGLHHMAGNVWQWCRDWYDGSFPTRPEASHPNPLNRTPGSARSERGGSWVGPASLCRSSFRRGRPPLARGRCLGFRCISLASDAR